MAVGCRFEKPDGERCRMAPLRDEEYCFAHSPEHAQEAAEARRMGGLRRRREKTVETAYEVEGLETVPQLRRVLKIATIDALGLDQSVSRCRVLIAAVQTGAKLLETGELEARIAALEATAQARHGDEEASAFDLDDGDEPEEVEGALGEEDQAAEESSARGGQ